MRITTGGSDDDSNRIVIQIYADIAADFTPVAVFGSPTTCIEGVREVIDAGAEMILFTPLRDEAAQMEHVAREVVPQLS